MNTLTRLGAVFGASVTISAAIGYAKDAEAGYERIAAASCAVITSESAVHAVNDGLVQNSGPNYSLLLLSCPYPDTSAAPHTSAFSILAGFVNNSNGYYVMTEACLQDYTDESQACGAFAYSYAAGFENLSLDTSAWRNTAYSIDFPYLFVELPGAAADLSATAFTGWFVGTNP